MTGIAGFSAAGSAPHVPREPCQVGIAYNFCGEMAGKCGMTMESCQVQYYKIRGVRLSGAATALSACTQVEVAYSLSVLTYRRALTCVICFGGLPHAAR